MYENCDNVYNVQLNFILKYYGTKNYLQIESKHDVRYTTETIITMFNTVSTTRILVTRRSSWHVQKVNFVDRQGVVMFCGK